MHRALCKSPSVCVHLARKPRGFMLQRSFMRKMASTPHLALWRSICRCAGCALYARSWTVYSSIALLSHYLHSKVCTAVTLLALYSEQYRCTACTAVALHVCTVQWAILLHWLHCCSVHCWCTVCTLQLSILLQCLHCCSGHCYMLHCLQCAVGSTLALLAFLQWALFLHWHYTEDTTVALPALLQWALWLHCLHSVWPATEYGISKKYPWFHSMLKYKYFRKLNREQCRIKVLLIYRVVSRYFWSDVFYLEDEIIQSVSSSQDWLSSTSIRTLIVFSCEGIKLKQRMRIFT